MEDEKKTPETPVVTEEQLLKSLKELEGKKDEPAAPAPPAVKAVLLQKSAATVDDKGTKELRKALDVSEVLQDFASVIGLHVDTVVETLEKSVNGAAERDLVLVAVLQKMNKSLTDLTEKVEAFGKTPGAAPKTITVDKAEVLEKGAGSGKVEEGKHKVDRKLVLAGLEKLAKSCERGTAEESRWVRAAVKFESANVISDIDLASAVKAAAA